MTDIEITLADLDDTKRTLGACLTFFTARDVQEAQAQMRAYRTSPLTAEIERLADRYDGYLSDYLIAKYEDEQPAEGEVEDDEEEEEILSDEPLGSAALPRQSGRRLSIDELRASSSEETVTEAVETDG